MRILIANRGEIARRIIRTAHRLGHETIAVHAEPDVDAPFVHEATWARALAGDDLSTTYLSSDEILNQAQRGGADAVHPGYGFLSENGDFARAVTEAGLTWIGPHAEAIDRMGSKIEARRLARSAGVTIIPGFDSSQDRADLAAAADRIGYPVLLKAAAGGGGKGIRIVNSAADFDRLLVEATTESRRAFGDDDMIVERYIQRPRHVEVQIVGDRHGTVVELGTRECSVQRRYQKILEEAPAPNLPDATRAGLRSAAAELARSIGYDSAGTVEFVVDDETGDYFFLEMNTRIQVEHTVTEEITGLDLIEIQIRSATGEPLAIEQSQVVLHGHAFEARINAEDPSAGFAPRTGTITHLLVPDSVRWDSGIELGSEIGSHYDSMVAKLIVHGDDRRQSLRLLRQALDELVIGGITTTAGFHRWLVDQPQVVDGRVTTRFLDETDIPTSWGAGHVASDAARRWLRASEASSDGSVWSDLGSFRTSPHRPSRQLFLKDDQGVVHDVAVDEAGGPDRAAVVDLENKSIAINDGGNTHTFQVISRSERWAPSAGSGHGHAAAVVAPFPAVVFEVLVRPGDDVAGGDVVVVIEAMKMLHSLTAAGPGVVEDVHVVDGDQIESNQVLVTFHISDSVTEGAAAHISDSVTEGAAAHTAGGQP